MSCAPSWRKAQDVPYNIFLFSFGFFCPLTIIIITSTIVICSIKQDSRSIISENIKSSALSRQYKAIKMVRSCNVLNVHGSPCCVQVLVLVGVFLFCWGPYAVLSLAGILGLSAAVPAPLTVLPLMMAKSSVLWSPIIYVTMHPPVQRQLCLPNILSDILVSGRCSKILRTV